MDNSITRLLKILALETKQGYRNKAVIGGLDKFVSRWEPGARAEVNNQPAMDEIVSLLLGYPAIEDTGYARPHSGTSDASHRRDRYYRTHGNVGTGASRLSAPSPAQTEAVLEPPLYPTASSKC